MSRNFLLAFAVLFISMVCEGADPGVYLGGSIGRSVEIEAVANVGADSGDPSFKLFGGIGIGENLAVEIGYHDFGKTTCCGSDWADLGFERNGTAYSASALVLWPIGAFRLFARAGALWWGVDGHDLTIEGHMPYSNDGVDLLAGLGGDLVVVRGLRIRLEWERFEIDDDDADSVEIGALWQF